MFGGELVNGLIVRNHNYRGESSKKKTRLAGLCDFLFSVFRDGLFCGFGNFGKGSFAAGSGVFLHEAFFDGFVVFGLDFGHVFSNWAFFESLESGFDVFFDLLIVGGALFGLARSLFRRFDNRH